MTISTFADPAPAIDQTDDSEDIRDQLRQSLETVLARHYSFEQRRDAHESEARESAAAWSAYAELGLLALSLPEEQGGLPAAFADIAMAAETMGGAMTLEPYIPTMVAARLIAAGATPAQQAAWLPGIVEGRLRAALAHEDDGARPVLAIRHGDGWRLRGRKLTVAGGDSADMLIVSARLDDAIALFLVPADAVERRAYRCFDWTGAADILLDDVDLPTDARLPCGEDVLSAALDEATALACADAVGSIRAANRLTRDHTHTRRQFGRSLDSFQVLQHRLVDMLIDEAFAAAITDTAIAACDGSDPTARMRAVSAAKVRVGEAARLVGEQCVQLHGGMGLVQEYQAAHLFARLGLFELSYGDRNHHLERYAALTL
ncbi:putative acyl-CoA dehydrogenase [Sphingobium sp. SYK-6]|uniref:acyl-CoA dehydrogenase family protein n=1 Tax=Sphingobium sp. (strain NBRC 103272 / SYK-6) TaxID=627192 RepID=UPI0002276AC7|nr:acyl-CoA dehydrogenase family protein [Sphingobium sp. SYK-6]BAK65438.1 putative acyl-CoA dehydrogenase [Sphingobium sp. SYK-6]